MAVAIKKRFNAQDELFGEIYRLGEGTRKYSLWTLIILPVVIIFPLVRLVFISPKFLSTYTQVSRGF